MNSLIFIHGSSDWVTPIPVDGQPVWWTSSCVATACYPEQDGPTEIVLGNVSEVGPLGAPVFEGMVETPQRKVSVTTVADDRPVLSVGVSTLRTRVRIWHSHPRWPERVTIGLG
ncbi:MAG: hypothetical protein ABWY64_27310 [Tardiphaga sp.]